MSAELDAFKRICMLMAAHGKVVTVSLKTHFSNISDQQGQYLCDKDMSDDNTTSCIPYGEEKVCKCCQPVLVLHHNFIGSSALVCFLDTVKVCLL
jgi:hypothetical protein